jgi:uncharacterized protein (DUF1684 family)
VEDSADALLQLADWRRRVAELYGDVRQDPDPEHAWATWCAVRDALIGTHPQSPLSPRARQQFTRIEYFPYDARWRTTAHVSKLEPVSVDLATSDGDTATFRRFGRAEFELDEQACALELYWLEAYGGGIYLSFRDASSGETTYGAGRYLLDTVKGADLGVEGDRLVLDFNFSYQPSCSYDECWSCPLPPPENRLPIPIEAGERLPA